MYVMCGCRVLNMHMYGYSGCLLHNLVSAASCEVRVSLPHEGSVICLFYSTHTSLMGVPFTLLGVCTIWWLVQIITKSGFYL